MYIWTRIFTHSRTSRGGISSIKFKIYLTSCCSLCIRDQRHSSERVVLPGTVVANRNKDEITVNCEQVLETAVSCSVLKRQLTVNSGNFKFTPETIGGGSTQL